MCNTATLVMMLIMVDVDKVVDVADHNDQNLLMTHAYYLDTFTDATQR